GAVGGAHGLTFPLRRQLRLPGVVTMHDGARDRSWGHVGQDVPLPVSDRRPGIRAPWSFLPLSDLGSLTRRRLFDHRGLRPALPADAVPAIYDLQYFAFRQ